MAFIPRYAKIIQSGDLLELYEYEKEPTPKKPNTKRSKRYKKYKSDRHIARAVANFRRKVRATLQLGTPYLLTLTMGDIVDIGVAFKLYTQFGARLRRVYGKEIAWITVPEFQKRGAVHFHILIWNLSHEAYLTERNTRRIQNLWGYGYVDIASTDGSPKLSGYLAKYMSKAMHDDRLFGKKAYSCSRNTLRSVSINSQTAVALIKEEFSLETLPPTTDREYDTEWLGKARRRSYEGTIEKKLQ